ncbi:hypothetical protein ACOI1C_07430 [Bacillus sp. DJP31]|uniref:hypothetical protein n=1 Tax=Bacillus sp. DJP31 TaxID=3409789 RepID=UPI003BB4E381
MKKRVNYEGKLLDMLEFLAEYWRRSFSALLQVLFKEKDRTSKGRRRLLDHERIFNNILVQIEQEEDWFLNNDVT